jgi:SNF2 family DNA or RNA helicase
MSHAWLLLHRIVVFSQYNTTLDAVRMKLEPQGFQFRTISSNMSIKKRSEALKAFLQDPPTTIFLLSMSVAALGLTLTVASRMFLMEPCLTPSQEQQVCVELLCSSCP